jgi:hypothetical protein
VTGASTGSVAPGTEVTETGPVVPPVTMVLGRAAQGPMLAPAPVEVSMRLPFSLPSRLPRPPLRALVRRARRLLAPVLAVLARVLGPVARALGPVARVLGPVVAPIGRVLRPVLGPVASLVRRAVVSAGQVLRAAPAVVVRLVRRRPSDGEQPDDPGGDGPDGGDERPRRRRAAGADEPAEGDDADGDDEGGSRLPGGKARVLVGAGLALLVGVVSAVLVFDVLGGDGDADEVAAADQPVVDVPGPAVEPPALLPVVPTPPVPSRSEEPGAADPDPDADAVEPEPEPEPEPERRLDGTVGLSSGRRSWDVGVDTLSSLPPGSRLVLAEGSLAVRLPDGAVIGFDRLAVDGPG